MTLCAHAVERDVDDQGGEQREDDSHAGDRAERFRDAFIGQRREEGHERRDRDDDQPAARLKRGGMAEREEIDQPERAARTAGGGAQQGDQDDAPQVGERRRARGRRADGRTRSRGRHAVSSAVAATAAAPAGELTSGSSAVVAMSAAPTTYSAAAMATAARASRALVSPSTCLLVPLSVSGMPARPSSSPSPNRQRRGRDSTLVGGISPETVFETMVASSWSGLQGELAFARVLLRSGCDRHRGSGTFGRH